MRARNMGLLPSEHDQRASGPATPAVIEGDRLSSIRPCEPADLSRVAALFEKTFRRGNRSDTAALTTYLHSLLFEQPGHDADITSQVSIAGNGELIGFICILPVRMSLGERSVRAALAGSLMVDEPQKYPLAGAGLLRSFIKGPQELSFSETSNEISLRMWEALKGSIAPLFSLEWIRLLRPAGAALAFLRDAMPAAGVLRPLASPADYLLRTVTGPAALNRVDAAIEDVAADDPALSSLIIRLAGQYRLAPQWSPEYLRWLFSLAGEKERYGPLICKIARDRRGREAGCFLYYARPGGVAFVLQLLAEAREAGQVVDALLADAHARGCVALRGRLQPELIGPLQLRNCFFVNRSSLTYKTKDADILAAIRNGDALLTGLSGESWTRLIGGFA
ncbi:MAG: hypothetical protein R3D62_10965 [Xanthobacteraceae bacterium]